MNHLSDKEIWKLIQADNKKAFDQMYHQNVQALFKYAYKITTDTSLIEDCIQELFIGLWKNRKSISIQFSIKQYLLLSIKRLLIRKLKQKKNIALSPSQLEKSKYFDVQLSAESNWIEKEIKAGKRQQLKESLKQLSPREKEAIYLKYDQELSYVEIAQHMSISVKAVYKLIHSGVKKLRKILNS